MSLIKDKEESRPVEDTVECVEALAKIIKQYDLGKIKIENDDFSIVIEGRPCPPPPPPMAQAAPAAAAAAVITQEVSPAKESEPESGNIITSPIIGTFYAAPAPDKPPFVNTGDSVSAGDVICIIESMKLMNEINSEFSGRVAEIYVKNGDAVEYGQKLMRIE